MRFLNSGRAPREVIVVSR